MDKERLKDLLESVRAGDVNVDAALSALARLPFGDVGAAKVDHHRSLRCGFAEVIYGAGKTPDEVVRIFEEGLTAAPCLLATRVNETHVAAVRARFPDAHANARARTIRVGTPKPSRPRRSILVVTAGTSDIPVAEEAVETLAAFGSPAQTVYDAGVAGLHRLLKHLPELQSAGCIICVAGMEAALPSVVGGLVACPVIAVPTSVGYGASFQGLAALLSALNTCASGVVTVNIDNGFGAAMAALRMVSPLAGDHPIQ